MLLIVGSIVVLVCVGTGFVMSNGQLLALWHPFEILIICGAATGAFITANPPKVHKAVVSGLLGVLKGSPYKKAIYMDALSLMYDLLSKARKEGMMAIEPDIEEPKESPIFQAYPKVASNHHAVEFICDYMRLLVSGNINPFEFDNLMDVELQTHHQQAQMPADAVTKVADGLPGFGIVAAVLGIVITMSALGGPPEEIGAKVAAALVGTFLGILMAYGFVAPIGTAMEHNAREEAKFFECLKAVLLAAANGYSPQLAVEFGRKVMYSDIRPSFTELEEHVKKKA